MTRLRDTMLKEARRSAGLPQRTVAEMSGITLRGYQLIEAGAREPAVGTAMRIAAAIGRRVDELFSGWLIKEVEKNL